MCDTILEENSNINMNIDEEESLNEINTGREQRKGLMSKLSKQMAKDFT